MSVDSSSAVSPSDKAPKKANAALRVWHWMEQLVGPKKFYFTFSPWVKWLALLAFIFISIGSVWGVFFAPPDYLQGESFRIIYIHVPTAALSMSLYFSLALMAIWYLVWKVKIADYIARAIAPFGFVLCVLSLLTGAIWGKPTWGTYWVWDARLTSMLVLAFLYAGIIALYTAQGNQKQGNSAAAILALVGSINLPIIKYSVVWWNSLHQGETFSLTAAPKMSSAMLWPLILTMAGFYLMAAAIVIYRTNTNILMGQRQTRWVNELVLKRAGQQLFEH